MAHQTVISPNFHVHPVFAQLLNNIMDSQIRHIERVLGSCCADSCKEQATVSRIDSGVALCLMHFREVERG
jgi:hypothetical protein